jgi:hypothetical protein
MSKPQEEKLTHEITHTNTHGCDFARLNRFLKNEHLSLLKMCNSN